MTPIAEPIETPALVIDRAALTRNIAAAAARAAGGGVRLRPHVKSHKSVAIAKMQLAAGACGITVAKSSEAVPFIEGGISDITVAHPLIDRRKIGRLLALAATHGTALTLIVDSVAGLDAVAGEAGQAGRPVKVQIKVDVGLHRCGVDPAGGQAVALARMIAGRASLRFDGIISHAGHAYAAADAAAVRDIAAAERAIMTAVAGRIGDAGIAVPCISVGSTPTVWLDDRYDGLTEIRPGNYVFMDLTQESLGVAARADIALSVLATVISRNDRYAIVDAGSKVMSSDRGPHGSTRLSGYGLAVTPDGKAELPIVSLSEEHGFVAHGGRPLDIGERLRLYPNHACTVVNLGRRFHVCGPDGAIETWPIDAAGTVL